MVKILLKLVFVTFIFSITQNNSFAQLTGLKNIPGDYPTLSAAITDLNTQGVGVGGVTLNLIAGNPETAPAGGYAITTTTGSVTNPITIQGNNNLITASAAHTIGALNDAVFKIIGTDNVTITGFSISENAANIITAAATNTMTEWGVALLYTTTTDGAQNCTIQSCSIDLDRTYQNTFGIYSNSTHSPTAVSTSATATTTAGGNSNLIIYSNNITDVNIGIVVVGPTAAADHNEGLDIGGTSLATGNTITNYGTTGTFSSYANVSGSVNGILVRNTRNYNVSYNTVTSSNGGTTAGTLRGIYVPAFSNAPTGTLVHTISHNVISLRSASAASAINGIHVETTTHNATTTLNINNNDFNNFGHTVTGSATIIFILQASAPLNININNNTFTNITVNTTGGVTFISNSVALPSASAIANCNNNSIVTGFNKTGAGGTVFLYTSTTTPSSPAGSIQNNMNNNFSNITVSGATTVSGWSNLEGATGGGSTKNISNNIFSNWSCGTSAVTSLAINFAGNNSIVSDNIISNISSGGTLIGVSIGAGNGGTQNVFANHINSLSSSGASAVTGITLLGGNSATNNIFNNKIYNIESNNSGGNVNGMLTSGTSTSITHNIYNNLIGDLKTPTASAADPIRGINITNTGATSTINVSFNSIYLNATSSGTNFGSSGIFHTTNATATTATLNLRNNIIVNLCTPAGTGITAAYRRSSTTLTNYGAVSDHNLFYAGTPGAANVIMYDGTTGYQTMTTYQPIVTPRDSLSVSELPPFLSTSGASPNFLHLDPFALSGASNGGINIAGITDDYDGDIRFGNPGYTGGGTAPDIGADEYNVLLALDMGVSMLVEPGTTGCHTSSDTVRIRINNYSNQTINFAINPVTVTSSVSGVNPMVFPVLNITSDTLVAFGFLDTTVFIGYDMSAVGTYTFNANTTVSGDGDPSNNAMVPTNIIISGGTANASDTSAFCAGESIDLSIIGGISGGAIQWQQSTNGGVSWNNIIGGTTTPYTIVPTDTTMYRAQTCGIYTSTSVTVTPTIVYEPIANDVTRCGPGSVILSATSNGSISWYDAPVGGTLLDTGNIISINVLATTNFYPEATSGGSIQHVGPLNNTIGTGTGFTGPQWLLFDAFSTFNLSSVVIYPTQAGLAIIELRNSSGVVLTTYNMNITAPQVNTPVTVPLNWTINPGTQYRFSTNASSIDLYRNDAGAVYPYTIPGVVSITGNSFDVDYYYFFYDWQIGGGCSSTRDTVTVTVTPSDTVTATVVTNPICSNGSTAINATSVNGNYIYTWSPAAGLSGTSGSTVTTTSDTTITYTVNAYDPFTTCAAYTFATVNVNEAPQVTITTPDTALCINSTLQLDGFSNSQVTFNGTVGLGTSTSTASSTTNVGPYGGLYGGAKHQYLITAAELTGAGISPGLISEIAFDVTNINSVAPLDDYTIKIDTTTLTAFTPGYAPVNNTVYYNTSYMPSVGWNYHNFSTPFYWNGTSNLIIEVCFNNINAGTASGNASVHYTSTTGINTVNYYRADDDPNVCAMLSGTPAVTRPNIRFSTIASVSYQWTPATGISDDTIVNPLLTAVSTNTYTLTVTDNVNGCTDTDDISVTVNPLPVFTIGNDTAVCSNIATTPFAIYASDNTLNYLWFDGAVTTGTLVNGPGTYWAVGTNAGGCSSSDTMVVTTVDPMSVDIDVNVVGTNSADLDAGPGYSSYLWSTSQTTQVINIIGNGTYFVQVTDANGCPNADTVSIIFSLGIDGETSDAQLIFYPNPSSGMINIAGSGFDDEPLKVEIMNISGQLVYQQNIQEPGENFIEMIDLSTVAEGTYIVKVTNRGKTYNSRIIIARK